MLRQILRCSFCRRSHTDVEKLVAGPARFFAGRVYICDRCAAQTIQIMESHSGHSPEGPARATGSIVCRVFHRLRWRRQSVDRGSECHAV